MRFSALVLAAFLSLVFSEARADALARIKDGGVVKLGYREDAAPFSYRNDLGEPAGYSVGLCGAVVKALRQELNRPDLAVKFVPVGAEDRFTAIRDGTIDLLCGATTATLSRRELVDFSLPTFIDGASVLYLKDGPADFEGLAGHKVGVRGGTTTEEALRNSLKKIGVDAQVVSVTDHKEGLRSLEAGEFSAYFADQGILLFLMLQSQSPDMLRLSGRFFTREPYALALPRGDSAFRLLVDRTLSRLYRTGKVGDYFSNAFGSAKPSKLLEALFVVSALPE
jgi:polar amino acid transport system substrate-binding protein/glutamate/aspartate transport system substrate-binding protein